MPDPRNIVLSQKLSDIPGKTLTALLVEYVPGGGRRNIIIPAASWLS